MVTLVVSCHYCGSQEAVRHKGLGTKGNQPHRRTGYKCQHCGRIFQLTYTHEAYELGIKEKVIDMALNGSGIRDTACALNINMNTVMSTFKKASQIRFVNPAYVRTQATLRIRLEADEQWSYVFKQLNP